MRALQLRTVTEDEWKVLEKVAASRTAPAAQVLRARLLGHLAQGTSAPRAAQAVGGVSAEMVRQLLKRFNAQGLRALEDRPRSGRRRTFTEEDRGKLVHLAQKGPQAALGEEAAACHWTLDTLLESAHRQDIPIGRTQLWRVLHQEGLRWWERGRTWLQSRDPEYAVKRGRSFASTPSHRRGAR